MRLFIAILLDENIKNALLESQREFRSFGLTGSYSPEENLHLTLSFIGEYDDPEEVIRAMEETRFEPFSLTLGGTGFFGDTLWAGADGGDELTRFVARLRRSLSLHGIPFDPKKFIPHITLVRRAGNTDAALSRMTPPPHLGMTVERISLMRSDRGRHGMIYTEIGSVPQEG